MHCCWGWDKVPSRIRVMARGMFLPTILEPQGNPTEFETDPFVFREGRRDDETCFRWGSICFHRCVVTRQGGAFQCTVKTRGGKQL